MSVMSIDARWNRNALVYCDLLHRKARQIRSNHELYDFYIRAGVEYLININRVTKDKEFHRVDLGCFGGPNNLKTAHLQDFIPCKNVGSPPVHLFSDGEEVLLFSSQTGNSICTYRINKCRHCFPPVG